MRNRAEGNRADDKRGQAQRKKAGRRPKRAPISGASEVPMIAPSTLDHLHVGLACPGLLFDRRFGSRSRPGARSGTRGGLPRIPLRVLAAALRKPWIGNHLVGPQRQPLHRSPGSNQGDGGKGDRQKRPFSRPGRNTSRKGCPAPFRTDSFQRSDSGTARMMKPPEKAGNAATSSIQRHDSGVT